MRWVCEAADGEEGEEAPLLGDINRERGVSMTQSQLGLLERVQTLGDLIDEHLDSWPAWKQALVSKKVDCLMALCETQDRREAERA